MAVKEKEELLNFWASMRKVFLQIHNDLEKNIHKVNVTAGIRARKNLRILMFQMRLLARDSKQLEKLQVAERRAKLKAKGDKRKYNRKK